MGTLGSSELKEILEDQRAEASALLADGRIIERDVPLQSLLGHLAVPNILAILGIRRCGKSMLSHLLLRGLPYGYVNFDDERLSWLGAEDLNDVLGAIHRLYGRTDCILLDEPQNIEGWELFANRLRRTTRVVVTGSNAHMLAGELSTHLTGRYIDFTLHPFSFREYLRYMGDGEAGGAAGAGTTAGKARLRERLAGYLEAGGLPEAYALGRPIVRRTYGDIIEKDVVRRFRVRYSDTLREMARYLVSNTGNEMTYSKLRKVFSLRRDETAKAYVSHLRDSHVLTVLERYSPKLKEQAIAPKKAYCADTGIVDVMGFRESRGAGSLYETAVANELGRRRSYRSQAMELYYWKDHGGRDVDFVVKEGTSVTELIQVAYVLDPDVVRRETDALLRASKALGCRRLTVVNDDREAEEDVRRGGLTRRVSYVPLWKWLLEAPPGHATGGRGNRRGDRGRMTR
jgi:predicted AAA+ superfamily ATPase